MTDEPNYGTPEDFKRMLGFSPPEPSAEVEQEHDEVEERLSVVDPPREPELDPEEQARQSWAEFLARDKAKRERDAEWLLKLHGGGDEAA